VKNTSVGTFSALSDDGQKHTVFGYVYKDHVAKILKWRFMLGCARKLDEEKYILAHTFKVGKKLLKKR
jgi:hypothetical protein